MIVERSVILDGAACSRIVGALVDAEARARRNGGRVDDQTAAVVREVVAVANAWRASRVSPLLDLGVTDGSPSGVSGGSLPTLSDRPFLSGRLPVAVAAELAGVTPRRLAQLGRSGGIRRTRVDGRWMYDAKGVEEYARSRGAGGPVGEVAGP